MILAVEILGIWLGLSLVAVFAGFPIRLKRRFDRHDEFIREARRLR